MDNINNLNKQDILSQVLSGDRDGHKVFEDATIKYLINLYQDDAVEYYRINKKAADGLGIHPNHLDRVVRDEICKQGKEPPPAQSISIQDL